MNIRPPIIVLAAPLTAADQNRKIRPGQFSKKIHALRKDRERHGCLVFEMLCIIELYHRKISYHQKFWSKWRRACASLIAIANLNNNIACIKNKTELFKFKLISYKS